MPLYQRSILWMILSRISFTWQVLDVFFRIMRAKIRDILEFQLWSMTPPNSASSITVKQQPPILGMWHIRKIIAQTYGANDDDMLHHTWCPDLGVPNPCHTTCMPWKGRSTERSSPYSLGDVWEWTDMLLAKPLLSPLLWDPPLPVPDALVHPAAPHVVRPPPSI